MGRVILVCGGREFGKHDVEERQHLFRALDRLHAESPIERIVHGDARGADALAQRWALKNGVDEDPYPADWDDIHHPQALVRYRADDTPYNAAAGWIRNKQMLDENPDIDLVVAFKGGSGTANMCKQAKERGVPVEHV